MNLKQKHLVLVVDDQDASAIEAICTSLGLTVHVATSQAGAEAMLAKQTYCLVIVDLHLPANGSAAARIGTGFNLVRLLRAKHNRDTLPVIVVTGHGQDHQHAVTAFKEGATDFAKKPFDEDHQPLDEKIVEALADTCEARHRLCPQAAGVALRERETNGQRHYSAAHRLHFTGEKNGDRCALLVDEQPRWVTLKTFEVLWDLAMADRNRDDYPGGAVPGTDLHARRQGGRGGRLLPVRGRRLRGHRLRVPVRPERGRHRGHGRRRAARHDEPEVQGVVPALQRGLPRPPVLRSGVTSLDSP